MTTLSNLKIGTRLALGFSIIVMLLIAAALVSAARLRTLDGQVRMLAEDRIVKVVEISHFKDLTNESAIEVRNIALSTDEAAVKRSLDIIAANGTKMTAILNKLEPMLKTDKGRALMQTVKEARKAYSDKRGQFLELYKAGKKEEARSFLLSDVAAAHDTYGNALGAFSDFQVELVDATVKDAADEYQNSLTLLAVLTLGAVAGAGVIAYLVARSVTRPVNQAVGAVQALAQGDFTYPIPDGGKDEVGQMLNAMKSAFGTLSSLVGGVKTSAETISVAAREIAQGNTDLSQRTEEQAASLEETAASMEELTGTVKQNSENARQASQLATSAAQVAEKGSDTVQGVVMTMEGISAASSKISDIISVIEGIAFQTNILALNAAVEAARAGEQGRGFAVVASEVRSLAQRSATASKEIKELITDSVSRVAAGTEQVGRAGTTMHEILSSIKRVNDIMGEIASASGEQSTGIDQVGKAVQQMDEVTQQNAALVEQASAAAHSLEAQSQELRSAVAIFRTNDAAPAARRPSAVPLGRKAAGATRTATRAATPKSAAARPQHTLQHTLQQDLEPAGSDWQSF